MEQIFKQIKVDAPIEKVWDYITDSKKLEQWLMPNNFEPELNKKFMFKCLGHTDEIIECEVLEIVPYEKIVLSWYAEKIGSDTIVTINIKQSDDGVIITLIHSGWDKLEPGVKPYRDEYDSGWQSFINEKLKQVLSN